MIFLSVHVFAIVIQRKRFICQTVDNFFILVHR